MMFTFRCRANRLLQLGSLGHRLAGSPRCSGRRVPPATAFPASFSRRISGRGPFFRLTLFTLPASRISCLGTFASRRGHCTDRNRPDGFSFHSFLFAFSLFPPTIPLFWRFYFEERLLYASWHGPLFPRWLPLFSSGTNTTLQRPRFRPHNFLSPKSTSHRQGAGKKGPKGFAVLHYVFFLRR